MGRRRPIVAADARHRAGLPRNPRRMAEGEVHDPVADKMAAIQRAVEPLCEDRVRRAAERSEQMLATLRQKERPAPQDWPGSRHWGGRLVEIRCRQFFLFENHFGE